MSKNDVVPDSSEGEHESETGGSHVVDIGITVDVGADDEDEGATGIELEFDEADLHAAAESDATTTIGAVFDGETELEPAEREALVDAGIDPDAVLERERSYRQLRDDGVAESIADALRRRLSLPWSFENDGDLDQRSTAVRGLGEAEREWIEVSGDETWQAFEYEHTESISVGRNRPAERPYPKPTPVTAVTGVGPADADTLAEAGIQSAERLATIDAMTVADLLDLNVLHVRTWRHNARELLE
ncbi:hypothetical protein ACFR99_10475 [Haloarchaeobius amylolyticus]|uniref:Helix-hairpin-helix domain-containing protein n=1 Tax=Haloarchaeobius amylolyticus TaxID=1198296 RepID=A0ABD6BFY9_9EURY